MVNLSTSYEPVVETNSYVIIVDFSFPGSKSLDIPIRLAIRSALALTLALNDDDDNYSFLVDDGIIAGNLIEVESVEDLIVLMEKVQLMESKDSLRLEYLEESMENHVITSNSQTLRIKLKPSNLLSIKFLFDPKLLSSTKASWFLQHFTTALHSILTSDLSSSISTIQYINPEELKTIQSFTKSPSQPSVYPSTCTTLPSFILNAASLFPNEAAIQFDDKTFSYSELIRLSKLFAQHLIKLGVKKGTIVPLLISKSAEMIFSVS